MIKDYARSYLNVKDIQRDWNHNEKRRAVLRYAGLTGIVANLALDTYYIANQWQNLLSLDTLKFQGLLVAGYAATRLLDHGSTSYVFHTTMKIMSREAVCKLEMNEFNQKTFRLRHIEHKIFQSAARDVFKETTSVLKAALIPGFAGFGIEHLTATVLNMQNGWNVSRRRNSNW